MKRSRTAARRTPPSRVWPGALGLITLTLLVYAPCLNGPFVWDDRDWTQDAEWFMSRLSGLWQIWTNPTCLQQYYPVTATTFWLDHHFWGYHSFPYHLENVLLHALSAVLFWQILRKLQAPGAWLAGALLAVHPVMVESVAWITERKNVLCLTLFLASLLAYGGFRHWWTATEDRSWRLYALSLAFFVLAILAKVTAFALPPALLLIAWWKCGRLNWRRDVWPTLPFLAVAVVVGSLVTWIERHHLGAKGAGFDSSVPDRLVLAGQALWFYSAKLLWPQPVCVIYHRWLVDSHVWWQWLASLAVVLVAALLWRFRARLGRSAVVALLFFIIGLIPVLGFMNVYGMKFAWVADRWVYLPALGAFALLGAALAGLPSVTLRRTAAALVIVALGTLTWRQAANFGSTDRFWQAAIAGNRSPWAAENGYGATLLDQGRLDEALEHLREAIRLAPEFPDARANLGKALLGKGDRAAALQAWEEALRLKPDLAPVHYNMGVILNEAGQTEPAVQHFKSAVESNPAMSVAHIDLGNILFLLNRLDEAEAHLGRALELRPGHPVASTSMGNIMFRRGRTAEALRYYEQALAGAPDHIQALANSTWILATSTKAELRNGARAVELGEKAVALTGERDPSMFETLAAAYAEVGRFADAASAARKALNLAEARGNQGMAGNLRQELTLYENSKPLRDGPGEP